MQLERRRVIASGIAALVLMTTTYPALSWSGERASRSQLLAQFKNTHDFRQQLQVAKRIAALHDRGVLPPLIGWLHQEDRHLRANAAFIFASLGDRRGFDAIQTILDDRSYRLEGQGVVSIEHFEGASFSVEAQIAADRWYAANLLGDLKDPRSVAMLLSLLNDKDLKYDVPWALGKLGDRRAIAPLIQTVADGDPTMRVFSIAALQTLGAKDALPALHGLLTDNGISRIGKRVTVADTAKTAIAELESLRSVPSNLSR